jgi:hypothetical protein
MRCPARFVAAVAVGSGVALTDAGALQHVNGYREFFPALAQSEGRDVSRLTPARLVP